MEIMTQLLVEKNIDVPDFARREEGNMSLEQEDGKRLHALGDRVKNVSHIYISDIFFSHLQSNKSESETSIPSLEETPNSSPKFPPKTSHFSLVFDVSSEISFPINSYNYYFYY